MKKFLLSGFITAMIFSIYAQTQVGRTRYDLQTNNSVCRRVATNPNGETVITYTRSHQFAPDFLDRGTGYNYSADGGLSWSENTFTGAFNRVDSSRTGWPNIVYTNSKEVIISHFAGDVLGGLQVLRRDLNTTDAWEKKILNGTTSTVPANNSYANAGTWSRAASNGDSIFVITSLSEGSDLPGMDGGLIMYRSTDAGATWVGPDLIPLVNSSNFVLIGGDNYSLDMNNNGKIAIVLGSYQVEVLTSTDWGNTFSKQTVVATKDINGNPNPLYSGLSGETLDTINTTDRSYSLVVDDNDLVHVWFGRNRSSKVESSTAGTNYFPLTVGLAYWNEGMAEASIIHESRLSAQQIGLCNPLFTGQVISNTGFGDQLDLYRTSLTSMASGGYDAAGNLFVAYAGLKPATVDDINDLSTTNNIDINGFHFSDIYILKSSDNGVTWEGPFNVSDEPRKECVYPGVPRKIFGTEIPVIWQQDTIPGVNLQTPAGVTHPDVENKIMFQSVSMASIITPVDITCPTIFENEAGQNDVTAFVGCDVNFADAFNNDDVPSGPDALAYNMLDLGNNPITIASLVIGNNNINIYIEDANGNSSDTLEAIIILLDDVTPPVVNLVGPSTVDVLINTSYTDPGITYSDNACYPTATPTQTDNVNPNIGTVGPYDFIWEVEDNNGLTTTVTRTVNVINSDDDAPIITDLGMQTETIEACDVWTDPGVTAFDNVDFDVTDSVKVVITLGGVEVPSVNTNEPGVYTLTYTASDKASPIPNESTYVRTITVEDTQAPEIKLSITDAVIYVCLDTPFVSPAATATDCATTNVSLSDNGSTVVNVNIAGTYTVTYKAEDNATPTPNVSTKTIEVRVGIASTPAFDYEIVGNNVATTDASTENPIEWTWDWDDNSNSYSPMANHSYTTSGSRNICLTVKNRFTGACKTPEADQKLCKDISIDVGIAEVDKLNSSVSIFPNPSNGLVNVNISQENLSNVEVSIVNVIGDIVSKKTIANTSKNSLVTFDLGENAAGVYIVNIKTEKASTSKKVIIK